MVTIAGGVVWNRKLGVVVVNQNHNSWSLPKGHVETGEEKLAGAIREIQEESGIPSSALNAKGEIACYTRKRMRLRNNDTDEWREITLYFFETSWETLAPEDPENPEAKWVDPLLVPDTLTNEVDKSEFRRIIATGIFSHNH